MFRLVSSETKLFYHYLQVKVAGLLKSMKVTPHKGQRGGPAIRKEFNTFLSPETVLFNSLNFVTTNFQTFKTQVSRLQAEVCNLPQVLSIGTILSYS